MPTRVMSLCEQCPGREWSLDDQDEQRAFPMDDQQYYKEFSSWFSSFFDACLCVEKVGDDQPRLRAQAGEPMVVGVVRHLSAPQLGGMDGKPKVDLETLSPQEAQRMAHAPSSSSPSLRAPHSGDEPSSGALRMAAVAVATAEREACTMQREDVAAWSWREVDRCKETIAVTLSDGTLAARDSADLDAGIGRIIVRAHLTCRDDVGIDATLEQYDLELHVRERAVEAARRFLEDLNSLRPHLVRRYLDPLTRWLHEQVLRAPVAMANGAYDVVGDLNEIVAGWDATQHASSQS